MQFKKESSLKVLRHVAVAAVLILASLVLSVLYTVDANRARVSITYASDTAGEFAISFADRARKTAHAPATSEKKEVSLGVRTYFRPHLMFMGEGDVEIRMASDDPVVKDNPVANLELHAVELHRRGMEPVQYDLSKLTLVNGTSVSQQPSSVAISLPADSRESFPLSGFGDEVVKEMETAFITGFCISFIVALLLLSGGYVLSVYTGLDRRVSCMLSEFARHPLEKIRDTLNELDQRIEKVFSIKIFRYAVIAAVLILASFVLSILYTASTCKSELSIAYTSDTAGMFAVTDRKNVAWYVTDAPVTSEKKEVILRVPPYYMSKGVVVQIRMMQANLELYAVELRGTGMESVQYDLSKLTLANGSLVSQQPSSVAISLPDSWDSFPLSGLDEATAKKMKTAFIFHLCASFVVILLILSGAYALCVFGGLAQRVSKTHVMALAICGMFAAGVFVMRALGLEYHDWYDAIGYLAWGKHMIEHGSYLPVPWRYSELALAVEQGGSPERVLLFANNGFMLLHGFWGLMSGRFSLMNGIYIGALFTVLTAFAVYGLSCHMLRDKTMAVLVVVGVLLHPVVFGITAQPLSDSGLLFFFVLTVWAMLRDRAFLAGLALGIAYFYREHAILFLPLIPLLSPGCVSVKSYMRTALMVGVAFLPGWLAVKLATNFFMLGQSFSDLYASYHGGAITKLIQGESGIAFVLERFFNNCTRYIKPSRAVFALLALYFVIKIRKLDSIVARLVIVALGVGGAACVVYSFSPGLDPRYFAYAVPLLMLAAAMIFRSSPRRVPYMIALVVLAMYLNPPRFNSPRLMAALSSPTESFVQLRHTVEAPYSILPVVMPQKGAVLLNNHTRFPRIAALDNPVLIGVPDYETFMQGKDNALLDGIVIRRTPSGGVEEGWTNSPVITDNAGVRFERVWTQELLPGYFMFYYRRVRP
jgi:hypothetical protein